MSFDLARTQTIAALATAPQPAAIAVVRVSGPEADRVRHEIFRPRYAKERGQKPFVATLGYVLDRSAPDPERALLDEALCTAFPEGRSYTGEAAFELSLHGGPSRVRSVLRSLVAAGCRLAEPGELTLRAVLTGRMDLTEAEAVHQLVGARSDEAARAALRNLHGGVSGALAPVREAIVDTLAELEARLDFPDEELGDAATGALSSSLEGARARLTKLLEGALLGRRLLEGARVVLFGAPNAGKSTLLNALVGEERALVHETPGTTRDVLEAETTLGGVPVLLVDVAGVREGEDVHPVEALGIARAKDELLRADLVLLVVDASAKDVEPTLAALREQARGTDTLVVYTKRDLAIAAPPDGALLLSAKTGEGVETLRIALRDRLAGEQGADRGEALLAGARQREEVERAQAALGEARIALSSGHVHEVVASELRAAGRALDRLLGKRLDEDVLDVVFSRFCIGK